MYSELNDRLTAADVTKFLTFENEELIFAGREHAILLILRLIKGGGLTAVGAFFFFFLSFITLHNIFLSFVVSALTFFVGAGFLLTNTVHWFFHFYVITNRKIQEVAYNPLFSETSNSILLDKLRCTEIDTQLNGIIPEMFDIGDVEITFDRPTHKEMFILKNIRAPRKIADLLSRELDSIHNPINGEQAWYRNQAKGKYLYTEQPQIYGGYTN